MTVEAVVRGEPCTTAPLLSIRFGSRATSAPNRLAEIDVVLVGQAANGGASGSADQRTRADAHPGHGTDEKKRNLTIAPFSIGDF